MTPEYAWRQHPDSKIWWLRPNSGPLSVGLIHRNSPVGTPHNPEAHEWYVAKWVPKEAFIAYLPADLPEAEALEAAKLLILLSLKERSQQ